MLLVFQVYLIQDLAVTVKKKKKDKDSVWKYHKKNKNTDKTFI